MITRYRIGAHICLRGQHRIFQLAPISRLANASIVRHSRGARHQHNQADSNSLPIRDENTDKPDEKQRFTITRTPVGVPEDARELYSLSGRHGNVRKPSSKSEGQLHGFLGSVNRERIEDQRFSSLGEQSEVIVLKKDSGIRYTYTQPRREYLDDPEPVDILKRLNEERGLISQAQVFENIDTFKPNDYARTVTWEEFKAVEKELNHGFLTTQLTQYIAAQKVLQNSQKPVQHDGISENAELEEAEPVDISVSAWMPGVSDDGVPFVSSWLRGYVADESFTQKQRVVVLLMRQCWKMEVIEVMASRGEIEMQIPSKQLDLLSRGNNPPLRSISNTFCESEEDQIEVSRSQEAIRITAGKEVATAIVEAIKVAVGNIRAVQIDLEPLEEAYSKQSPNFQKRGDPTLYISDNEIAELSSITDTVITRGSESKLKVTGSSYITNRLQSTCVDVARRLLFPYAENDILVEKQIGLKDVERPLTALRYDNTAGLSWRDRMKHWVRWTTGVTKTDFEVFSTPSADLFGREELKPLVEPSETLIDASSVGESHPGQIQDFIRWDIKTFTTSSIVFGHVLHESQHRGPVAAPVPSSKQIERTTFMPVTQNLTNLLKGGPTMSSEAQASILMRFIPSPWTAAGSNTTKKYPPIQMRFSIDRITQQLELIDVVAIISASASDVMLPDRSLDIRFRQKITCRLISLHYHQLDSIKDFLYNSQLNISKGPLMTPPSLNIPISGHLYNQAHSPDDVKPDSLTSVEYLFAGLEHQTAFSTAFAGWKLLYTTIEGGKANGSRTELTLRPSRIDPRDNVTKLSRQDHYKTRSKQFVEAAFKLVDALEETKPDIRKVGSKPGLVRPVYTPKEQNKKKAGTAFAYFARPIFNLSDWVDEDDIYTLEQQMAAGEVDPVPIAEDDSSTSNIVSETTAQANAVNASAAWGDSTPDESNGKRPSE